MRLKDSGSLKVGVSLAITVFLLFFLILGIPFRDIDRKAEAVIGSQGNLGDLSVQSKHRHNLSASGTLHDIRSDEPQICIFCHSPHNSFTPSDDPKILNAPLWNHRLSSASYNMNAITDEFINTTTATVQPDGASKLCLSCHDGTVGVGEIYSRPSTPITMLGACLDLTGAITEACGGIYFGTTPSHHIFSVPINDELISDVAPTCPSHMLLKYPWQATGSAPANPNVLLRPTTVTYKGFPGIDGGDVGLPKYKDGYFYGVQCTSCHDPHMYREVSGTSCKFLVDGCVGDLDPVCLACHSWTCI